MTITGDGADTATDLCRTLAGFDDVSPRFAHAALADMRRTSGADPVDLMLTKFAVGGVGLVVGDPDLAPHARALLLFLYTGFAADGQPGNAPENHFESLMWRAALAHPPALSGGYFGHWAYPPDEANP